MAKIMDLSPMGPIRYIDKMYSLLNTVYIALDKSFWEMNNPNMSTKGGKTYNKNIIKFYTL